jgi:hypothetical protein
VAGLRGVEPPTTWFVARCSIQLSYRPAETTHAFLLDYDTLRVTSTASGTFGAGFSSPCIHLRSTVLPLNWRRPRSDRSHSPAARNPQPTPRAELFTALSRSSNNYPLVSPC